MSERDREDGDPRPPREPLTLVHHHPGRLRVRADAFREGAAGPPGAPPPTAGPGGADEPPGEGLRPVDRVRAALDAEPGIAAFLHNPRTGSILVEYEPGLADS